MILETMPPLQVPAPMLETVRSVLSQARDRPFNMLEAARLRRTFAPAIPDAAAMTEDRLRHLCHLVVRWWAYDQMVSRPR